jgi:hypothetical protein
MYVAQQNDQALNKTALRLLNEAKADAPPHHLHLLNLAAWGLEIGVSGEWPEQETHALQAQVDLMFAWRPENVMAWLLAHPDGPDRQEQEATLHNALMLAERPRQAAAALLGTIYARMQADNPALQASA